MAQISTEQAIEPTVRAWTRLLRAYASTTRLLSAELQEAHGLSLNDYEALLVLSRADGGRLKRVDLARSLMLTPSGITRLLEGLEDAGLVERAACATDLRVTYAQLTDAGREKLQSASRGHIASIRALFEEHFAQDEVEAIAEILGKLPGVAEGDDSCSPG
ncbi:MAG TPA: MarR family transcriptional regulator [Gaiellaceae bacterium]|jgi:DNA-binding MarR family transcriptional regulator|nr:MarR family transcriptional regulator [Gaiellaceae bacterium]